MDDGILPGTTSISDEGISWDESSTSKADPSSVPDIDPVVYWAGRTELFQRVTTEQTDDPLIRVLVEYDGPGAYPMTPLELHWITAFGRGCYLDGGYLKYDTYCKRREGTPVVPSHLRTDVIEEARSSLESRRPTVRLLMESLEHRYWWPYMLYDIIYWVDGQKKQVRPRKHRPASQLFPRQGLAPQLIGGMLSQGLLRVRTPDRKAGQFFSPGSVQEPWIPGSALWELGDTVFYRPTTRPRFSRLVAGPWHILDILDTTVLLERNHPKTWKIQRFGAQLSQLVRLRQSDKDGQQAWDASRFHPYSSSPGSRISMERSLRRSIMAKNRCRKASKTIPVPAPASAAPSSKHEQSLSELKHVEDELSENLSDPPLACSLNTLTIVDVNLCVCSSDSESSSSDSRSSSPHSSDSKSSQDTSSSGMEEGDKDKEKEGRRSHSQSSSSESGRKRRKKAKSKERTSTPSIQPPPRPRLPPNLRNQSIDGVESNGLLVRAVPVRKELLRIVVIILLHGQHRRPHGPVRRDETPSDLLKASPVPVRPEQIWMLPLQFL